MAKLGRKHDWLQDPQCEEINTDRLVKNSPGLPNLEIEQQAHNVEGERQTGG